MSKEESAHNILSPAQKQNKKAEQHTTHPLSQMSLANLTTPKHYNPLSKGKSQAEQEVLSFALKQSANRQKEPTSIAFQALYLSEIQKLKGQFIKQDNKIRALAYDGNFDAIEVLSDLPQAIAGIEQIKEARLRDPKIQNAIKSIKSLAKAYATKTNPQGKGANNMPSLQ